MPAQKPVQEVDVEVLPREGSGKARRQVSDKDDPFIALVAKLMDTVFVIPGTNIRFGLDPILGLIPGLGDSASAFVSIVLILQSARHRVPKVVLARMAMNVLVNAGLGAVPVVGDAFSVYYKSNAKNYDLLRKHANTGRKADWKDWAFVWGLIGAIVLVVALVITGIVTVISMIFGELRGG